MQFMMELHMGTDIHCLDCREVLGWTYKEGRFMFQQAKIIQESW
jgi:hypothetical protein